MRDTERERYREKEVGRNKERVKRDREKKRYAGKKIEKKRERKK